MSALENSIYFLILKEIAIFFTNIGDLLLKIFCYTLFSIQRYKNHSERNLSFITQQLTSLSSLEQ